MRTSSRFVSLVLITVIAFATVPHAEAASRTISFEEEISVSDLQAAYEEASVGGDKVRILIMPGHEPDFGGAQFAGYYEREFVVDIANRLQRELATDANFEVLVARGTQGWNDDFEYYFDRQGRKIERFVEDHKEDFEKLQKRGRVKDPEAQSAHNKAPEDVALRLYGINKWVNENDVDLVLHLHLNDEVSRPANSPGIHSGAVLYIPDEIYGNAKTSRAIAEPIFARLNTTTATSTFGHETSGVLESRELIAIGAFNTVEAPSLLLEYGYLYEPRITGGGARSEVFDDFAYQTALGVKDFFGSSGRARFSTKVLPYIFTNDILATTTASTTGNTRNVYALQAALADLGFYPGEASFVECPISGIMNVCTVEAIKAFQVSTGIAATGDVGAQTRVAINNAFGLATPGLPLATVPVAASSPSVAAAGACTAFTAALAPEVTDATSAGEVSRLQTLLARDPAVYPEALVTGYFGPATLAAVKRFQEKQAVTTSENPGYGLVGPATKAALIASCSST